MCLSTELPDRWKPDRCRFVLTEQPALNRLQVAVDSSYPDAWRKEPFYSQFRQWARNGTTVSVFVGGRVIHMLPSGEERESTKATPRATTSAEVAQIAVAQLRNQDAAT